MFGNHFINNIVLKLQRIYHVFVAVNEVKKRLVAAGFKELREIDHWTVHPQDKVCLLVRRYTFWFTFIICR